MKGRIAELEIDLATGQVLKVQRYHYRKYHEENGPALIQRDPETNVAIREGYFLKGKHHREDGPAWVERLPDGQPMVELFYRQNFLHREPAEGPAIMRRSEVDPSFIVEESYYLNGWPHRDPNDGPWRTMRNARTGEIESEDYLTHEELVSTNRGWRFHGRLKTDLPTTVPTVNYTIDLSSNSVISETFTTGGGILHREDGPAFLEYDKNGNIIEQVYYLSGRVHRDPKDGPASIWSTPGDPDIITEGYCSEDQPCAGPEGAATVTRNRKTGQILEMGYLTKVEEPAADRDNTKELLAVIAQMPKPAISAVPDRPSPAVPAPTIEMKQAGAALTAAVEPASPLRSASAQPAVLKTGPRIEQPQPVTAAPQRRLGWLGSWRWPSFGRN
jgi:hypothetical protein